MVKLESIARESCRLRMSKVGLESSLVSKGIGVSSCLRVSSTSSLVECFGVGVPWEGKSLGSPLAVTMMTMTMIMTIMARTTMTTMASAMRASLLPAGAARCLVIEGTHLVARGAREGSLRMQDVYVKNDVNDFGSSSK